MAIFCGRCGGQTINGVCPKCGASNVNNASNNSWNVGNNANNWQNPNTSNPMGNSGYNKINFDTQKAKGFFEKMKNRMGIGSPELNSGDAFENGKNIVPDCVEPNEKEVPIKQYKVAKLRNKLLGIPYSKAIGRIQVTNKRVIFRAPGRSIAGRTTIQQEFQIDEIAGIEARREYAFDGGSLFLAILVSYLSIFISALLFAGITSTYREVNSEALITILVFLATMLGLAGFVPFFLIKRKWLLKALCLSTGFFLVLMNMSSFAYVMNYSILYYLVLILWLLEFVCLIFSIIMEAIQPNLVLVIKNKGAIDAIDIQRKKKFMLGRQVEDHTGYTQVMPEDDVEKAIKEINSMITDVQKLGDFGIDKWKVK